MSIFLDPDDVVTLTGEKRKAHQVQALRVMEIAFFVNPPGKPIVTKSALEGKLDTTQQ